MSDDASQTLCRILYLEDDRHDREFVANKLRDRGIRCEFTFAGDRAEFEAGLERRPLDLIFCDFHLPTFDGRSALALARERRPDVPFIYVSGTIGEDCAIESLRTGATDYVCKENLERLAPVVQRALRETESRRKQAVAERAAREASQLSQQIISSAQEGIVVQGLDLKYQVWNPYMEKTTGLQAGEVIGRHPFEVLPFLRQTRALEIWTNALKGEQCVATDFEYEVPQTSRKGWASHSTSPLRDAAGNIVGVLSIVRAITDQKRAALELEESRRVLKALLDNIPDPVWLKSKEGRFLACNKPLARFYGKSVEAIIGKTTAELLPNEAARWAAEDSAVVASKEPVRVEESVRDAEGHDRCFETIKSPIADRHGEIIGTVGIARDITERKALEAQFRQAQKMEGIGQLAGGVAHDFNNLLAVMRGNADLLLIQPELLPPKAREFLLQITAAAERAAGLTRQLLLFSRKQVIQLQPVNLNDIVVNLSKMLKRIIGENIRLQCQTESVLPSARGDVGMIEQVLVNLAVNARDAMPNGGELYISTKSAVMTPEAVHLNPERRAGEFVSLTVRDTGTGISAEVLPRIFEPFFTTKEAGKGTGLGLATVYGIVRQHHGWIEVGTRLGVGSAFTIYLPVNPAQANADDTDTAQAPLAGGKETILVVEDDALVREVTRKSLETFGYTVLEAPRAREAIEIWAGRANGIDLLLTDMVLPEGITGRMLAESLRSRQPGLKVIIMSGYSPEIYGSEPDIFQTTKSSFLRKPFSSRDLIEAVRKRLDAPE